jgi:hypothetical protein
VVVSRPGLRLPPPSPRLRSERLIMSEAHSLTPCLRRTPRSPPRTVICPRPGHPRHCHESQLLIPSSTGERSKNGGSQPKPLLLCPCALRFQRVGLQGPMSGEWRSEEYDSRPGVHSPDHSSCLAPGLFQNARAQRAFARSADSFVGSQSRRWVRADKAVRAPVFGELSRCAPGALLPRASAPEPKRVEP